MSMSENTISSVLLDDLVFKRRHIGASGSPKTVAARRRIGKKKARTWWWHYLVDLRFLRRLREDQRGISQRNIAA